MQGEEITEIWDFVLKREYKEAMCVQEMVIETNDRGWMLLTCGLNCYRI